MTRLWQRSLAAQFILALLLALALSQVVSVAISWIQSTIALRAAAKGEFCSRTETLALLLDSAPQNFKEDILRVSATSATRFWISPEEPVDTVGWRKTAWASFTVPLKSYKPSATHQSVAISSAAFAQPRDPGTGWSALPKSLWPLPRPAKFLHLDTGTSMGLAVRMDDGTWLNAAIVKNLPTGFWTSQSITSLVITAIILSGIAIVVARSITRPMRRIATASEQLGRGEPFEPLPETGPDDIRQTAAAFNRMQARIERFVEDRTRMLAAIGHDLRTPLTSLRLRAEFVNDRDTQEKMLTTIAEIQAMSEAALSFAREEATKEDTRTVELSALTESLCDDLAELGLDVTFAESDKINYRCRPEALRRAMRNLVENAVRYGERARVSLAKSPDGVDIIIDDNGPGIPEEMSEQVFAPFFRLENSRNRETGGVGLGLSIARTIVRHHGGDISLANRPEGLRALVSLPDPH
jgi:signal transduction histidine kinase